MKKSKLQASRYRIANFMVIALLVVLVANAFGGVCLAFAQTANPVSGAFVTASGNGSGIASSDIQGVYNITSFLESGNYSVEASATGFIDTTVRNISVVAGVETRNVNILMPISGGISGRITDALTSLPLQNVVVQAVNITGGVEYGSSALTDSTGAYQIITNLATGTYNVTAIFSTGHLSKSIAGVAVTVGVMTNNVNLALDRSAVISGIVRDSVTNAVLPNVTIYAASSSGGFGDFATTNSSGQYILSSNIGTGTYSVSALFPANHLPRTISGFAVVAGNPNTLNILLDPSGIISGRVTSSVDGSPVAGASVTATGSSFFGFATTNATGYYRITDGLGTASYTVLASFGIGFNFVQGVSVTQGSETPNVNIQLVVAPSGTIRGRVTNSTGSPIEFASVSADGGASGSGSATADANGDYVINTGLGTGTYTVTVSETGYVSQVRTSVSVTVSQVTSNINFALQAAVSGRISGLVQTLGTPIPEFHTELMMVVVLSAASIAVLVLRKLKTSQLKPSMPL